MTRWPGGLRIRHRLIAAFNVRNANSRTSEDRALNRRDHTLSRCPGLLRELFTPIREAHDLFSLLYRRFTRRACLLNATLNSGFEAPQV